MAEKRVTKKAIVASLLSVAVCTSMLIGTSYAWFTDTASSTGNVIKAGTLKVDFEYADAKDALDTAQWKSAKDTAIFNNTLWEPGYVDAKHIRITNKGTLALKYTFAIKANGVLETNANGKSLADAIDVYWYDPAQQINSRDDVTQANYVAPLSTVLGNFDEATAGDLAAGESDQITVVLKMREDAGNEYQGMSLGTDFSLVLMATQDTVESDTFDDQYDKDANGIPDHPEWGNLSTSGKTTAAAGQPTIINATGATLTAEPGVFADGQEVTFSVTPSDAGAVAINAGQTQVVYDISVSPESNGLKTVTLNIGKGFTGVKVYHNQTLMNDTDYSYNKDTGILTITSATFSPFAIVMDTNAGVKAVTTVEELEAALLDPETTELDVAGKNLVVLADTEITKPVTISNAVFDTSDSNANVAVYNADFKEAVTFENCTFESNLGILQNKFEKGATFENCTMHNTNYGIYNNAASGDVTFKNCTLKSDWCYTINFQGGTGNNIITIEDCDITGWCSFGSDCFKKVVVKNTIFRGGADYNCLRIYQNAEFEKCTFMNNFYWTTGTVNRAIDACASNITITLNDCTVDNDKLTQNGASLAGVKFVVNGAEVAPTVGSRKYKRQRLSLQNRDLVRNQLNLVMENMGIKPEDEPEVTEEEDPLKFFSQQERKRQKEEESKKYLLPITEEEDPLKFFEQQKENAEKEQDPLKFVKESDEQNPDKQKVLGNLALHDEKKLAEAIKNNDIPEEIVIKKKEHSNSQEKKNKEQKMVKRMKTALRFSQREALVTRAKDKLLKRLQESSNAKAENVAKPITNEPSGNTLLGAEEQINPTTQTTTKQTKEIDLKSFMGNPKK